MREERIEQLFRAISRADSSTTREYGGAAPALAVSKRLTKTMDGYEAARASRQEARIRDGQGGFESALATLQDIEARPC